VEGRTLTEISLRMRNHAKPYLKIELPAGAQLVTAEVEGQRVKPVEGGRVPLLRAGLDSSRAYTVSFVYLSEGARFAKNGSYDIGLPKLDIPVNLLKWEVSLPDRLEVKQFGGNAFAAELFPAAVANNFAMDGVENNNFDANFWNYNDLSTLEGGQIGGIVVDQAGAVVPGAQVTVSNTQTGASQSTTTNGDGNWVVSGMPPGPLKVVISQPGFKNMQYDLELQASKPARMGTTLEVANASETVQVTSGAAIMDTDNRRIQEMAKKKQVENLFSVSDNVVNLQRRVAGILPVPVEVPRSGKSYRFVRPLVLEEETRSTFQYKSR
jgi:Carboxypeptidase regulatory-like domain